MHYFVFIVTGESIYVSMITINRAKIPVYVLIFVLISNFDTPFLPPKSRKYKAQMNKSRNHLYRRDRYLRGGSSNSFAEEDDFSFLFFIKVMVKYPIKATAA